LTIDFSFFSEAFECGFQRFRSALLAAFIDEDCRLDGQNHTGAKPAPIFSHSGRSLSIGQRLEIEGVEAFGLPTSGIPAPGKPADGQDAPMMISPATTLSMSSLP
jgi:hypothetical protein